MKTIFKIAAMSILSIWGFGANAQSIKKANKLFKEGKFPEAKNEYSAILEKEQNNMQALTYMGYTSFLSNNLNESERWFLKAKSIKPNMTTLNYFLAQIYYRKNEFQKTVQLFQASGREAMAKKMESFKNIVPYETENNFDEIKLKFVITDPLPIVEVVINEKFHGNFIIDTGGGELILDEKFAQEVCADTFGIEKGSEFGGGKTAPIGHGRISSIMLDNQVIKNIPINTLNLRHIELGGIKIDGAIGTVFLYHFLSTIDYKNGQLILKNKSKYSFENILQSSNSPKIIPFAMADDHYMVTQGSINNSGSILFFIDSGLAGNAFTCPKSTLKKADLKYQKDKKTQALGGGGYYDCYPFDIDKICLSDICVNNLHGQYGPFPMQIEKSFGFNIAGLLSHEFFRKYCFTIDFEKMQFILSE